jgi:predicted nucleic acid-binding protein
MLVISDASPVNVLIRIELVHVLPMLYGRVIIPSLVAGELADPRAPKSVREFMALPPKWVEVQSPREVLQIGRLGDGEAAAISLAREIEADLLLVDDRKARREAARLGVNIVGTIGILEAAADRDLVNLSDALARLRMTDFKASDRLFADAIYRENKRRRQMPGEAK